MLLSSNLGLFACGRVPHAGFFYKSYERPYYWFEAVDMLRKFLLVAGLAMFEQGSPVQLMLAQLVCLIFLSLVLNTAPYKKDDVDFTNQASLVSMCMCGNALAPAHHFAASAADF